MIWVSFFKPMGIFEGGFNKLADRISRFDEVESCYLMSGAYDLLVVVKGRNLQAVAGFVSAPG